ncbi:MAG: ATP-binding protein, partial [Dolichospermum sp.]
MKIHQFEYQDHEYQWKLEPVKFLPHINLLVGISGVGKTEILKAIRRLNKIANGASLNGVEWNIEFSTSDNVNYHWQGRFEVHQITQIIEQELDEGEITDSKDEGFRILSERLYRNDIIIVERDEEKIILNGKQTPKLSLFQSVVYILNREDDIIPVKTELEKVIFVDYEKIDKTWKIPISVIKQYENSSLKKLKESDLPTPVKLSILYRYFRQEFNKIQKLFQTIFPKVIDIKIEPFKKDKLEQLPAALSDILRDAVTINIKEKRVNDWIENISSGMLKTFMYISELSLSPEGAVILIDEFE